MQVKIFFFTWIRRQGLVVTWAVIAPGGGVMCFMVIRAVVPAA
jgi:hypothetical protein